MNDARTAERLVEGGELGLVTDLYQLTMAQTYLAHGLEEEAVFELFFRALPPSRNFLVAAGLGTVLAWIPALRFPSEALEHLSRTRAFEPWFLDWLARWRFRGEVWAILEGTPVFPGEPLVQVVAPLPDAQLLETLVMNQVHFQTLVASKAARVVLAARGRPVIEFGLRRAHGVDAGMKAARAAYLAGAEGTSNVLAAARYGIPARGTMAHSAIQAIGDDLAAFRIFAETDPRTVCLVDTFDTMDGVRAVIALSRELGARFQVRGIRLDSGDLEALSREARAALDAAGLSRVTILASGGLDEWKVARLVEAKTPIDAFGVGTTLDVSADAPALDCAYKLVAYAGTGRAKRSPGKATVAGRKQVFRGPDGDAIGRFDEHLRGTPLLERVLWVGGVRIEPLAQARDRCARLLSALPAPLRGLDPAPPWPVSYSAALRPLGPRPTR